MDKIEHPQINTGGLTAEVRKAMARQVLKSHALPVHVSAIEESSALGNTAGAEKNNSTQPNRLSTEAKFGSLNFPLSALPKSPRLQPQPQFEPHEDDEYHLNDLLKFHDADFLNAAYRAVLKREPDSFGYSFYLEQLRAGHLDKVDLLGALRFSPEGKLKNVKINGLALPTFVRRLSSLPIIGYPIRLGSGILRLPSLIHRVRRQEAHSAAQSRRLAEHVNEIAQHVDTLNDALTRYLSSLAATTTDLLSSSELHDDQVGQLQQQLETLFEQQQRRLADVQKELITHVHNVSTRTQEQSQRLIQEQQSLLESSTKVTRNRIAQLESSTEASIAQLDDSTQARLAQFDASALARTTQLESSTRDLITQLETSARASIAQLETSARASIAQLESSLKAEIASVGDSTNDLRTKVSENESVTSNLHARISTVESSSEDLRSDTDQLQSSASTMQAEIEKVYRQLQHARTELAVQGSRMALILDEARRHIPASIDQQQLQIIAKQEQHKLDALYAELEDNFRGSFDEIKDRFRTYLPNIQSVDVTNDKPIVDLGCGRGEWLELLREEGHTAVGVDTNRVLLDRCRARGLDVVESEVLQYLRGHADNSLGAITAFHIIEHLEIGVLMQLLDEIVRVVQPGGVVIFETPNPENVLVGSNYFYFDPTHRNPLPSLLMKFLLESRGLQRVEVMNLHAWDQARLEGKTALTKRFNDLFYGPMDYAIAGWKASA
jgi:O-antigen chain-terminating methyltransferase